MATYGCLSHVYSHYYVAQGLFDLLGLHIRSTETLFDGLFCVSLLISPSGLIPTHVIWRTCAPVVASSGFLSSLIRRKRGNLREMPFSGSTWGQTGRQTHSQYTAFDAREHSSFVTCIVLKRLTPRCFEYIVQATKSPLVRGLKTSKTKIFKNHFSSKTESALLSYFHLSASQILLLPSNVDAWHRAVW